MSKDSVVPKWANWISEGEKINNNIYGISYLVSRINILKNLIETATVATDATAEMKRKANTASSNRTVPATLVMSLFR
jgi:hypothetical protein